MAADSDVPTDAELAAHIARVFREYTAEKLGRAALVLLASSICTVAVSPEAAEQGAEAAAASLRRTVGDGWAQIHGAGQRRVLS